MFFFARLVVLPWALPACFVVPQSRLLVFALRGAPAARAVFAFFGSVSTYLLVGCGCPPSFLSFCLLVALLVLPVPLVGYAAALLTSPGCVVSPWLLCWNMSRRSASACESHLASGNRSSPAGSRVFWRMDSKDEALLGAENSSLFWPTTSRSDAWWQTSIATNRSDSFG